MTLSLRKFVLFLGITFVFPWLFLIVIPHGKMKKQVEAVSWQDEAAGKTLMYPAGTPNIFQRGHAVYAAEGCANCHTQYIRPMYLGSDSYREGFGKAGTLTEPVRIRETQPGDYAGEDYAYLGNARIGPDLSNVGYRYTADEFHLHLYKPQAVHATSLMPPFSHLYEVRKIRGQRSADALALTGEHDPGPGMEVVPTETARALVDYLTTLKKDSPLPEGMAPVAAQPAGEAAADQG